MYLVFQKNYWLKEQVVLLQGPTISEQRQDTRYTAKPGAFAVLHFSIAKIAQILDLAAGGMAFFHVSTGKWPRTPFQIDLLFDDEDFNKNSVQILSIPACEIVYEKAIPGNDMVRRGIRFGNLYPDQHDQLERYIKAAIAVDE